MSHELRTPLNEVLGFTQLMERDLSLSAQHRQDLGTIRRSGEHLLGLISDVISIARIEAGKVSLDPAPFDLHDLVQSVVDIVRGRAQGKGLSLAASLPDGGPLVVRGDAGKLRQVLLNLLANAVKFTDRGSVTLR